MLELIPNIYDPYNHNSVFNTDDVLRSLHGNLTKGFNGTDRKSNSYRQVPPKSVILHVATKIIMISPMFTSLRENDQQSLSQLFSRPHKIEKETHESRMQPDCRSGIRQVRRLSKRPSGQRTSSALVCVTSLHGPDAHHHVLVVTHDGVPQPQHTRQLTSQRRPSQSRGRFS